MSAMGLGILEKQNKITRTKQKLNKVLPNMIVCNRGKGFHHCFIIF